MHEDEPRSHDWLTRYANQQITHDAGARWYLKKLIALDRPFGFESLDSGKLDPWDIYHQSRGGAALIGRKAFLWRTRGTPQFGDARVVEEILAGLRVFQAHQTVDGDFELGDAWAGHLPHHELAWRLEPMIWARIWLDDALSGKDKRWIDAMLHRGAERLRRFARSSPNDTLQYCNRGMVWLAVMTLAGLYFDKPSYLRAVERGAARIITHTITARGEVLENYLHYGGGIDTGYSFTTLIYAFMYRLLSGNESFDERLLACQKWAVRMVTQSGYPLASSASVRYATTTAWVCDLLPSLALFASREPFLGVLADRLAGTGTEHPEGHCLHPYIWRLFAGNRGRRVSAPAWYRDEEDHYEHPPSQYSIVRHQYQAGVTWRGIHAGRGLQTFAWSNEDPLIHPAEGHVSTVCAGRESTAHTNLSAGPWGWEIFRRNAGPGDGYEPASPATFIVSRRGGIWECTVFTKASVVYIANASASLTGTWVLHGVQGSRPRLAKVRRCVSFARRQGCLYWATGKAAIEKVAGTALLQIKADAGPIAIGLSNREFRFLRGSALPEAIAFRDSSGTYKLDLRNILDKEGNINRDPAYWDRVSIAKAMPIPISIGNFDAFALQKAVVSVHDI